MTRRYYALDGADPANQAQWSAWGDQVPLYGDIMRASGILIRNVQRADPSSGVYESAVDTPLPPCPESGQVGIASYYTRDFVLSLSGPVGNPASQVVETLACTQLPIEVIYERKRGEIARYDQSVRYNAVDTSLAANWWLVVTQNMRFEVDGIQGNWLQRQVDSLAFPSGPNAPWVGIYNAGDGRARRVQVTDAASWNTLYLEKTNHDQATGNATEASLATLDTAYDDGNGVWTDVADHDAADPAWGYPPTVDLSDEARQQFGG